MVYCAQGTMDMTDMSLIEYLFLQRKRFQFVKFSHDDSLYPGLTLLMRVNPVCVLLCCGIGGILSPGCYRSSLQEGLVSEGVICPGQRQTLPPSRQRPGYNKIREMRKRGF